MTKLYLISAWALLVPLAVFIWLRLLRKKGPSNGVEYIALIAMVILALLAPLPLYDLFGEFMALPLK